jgi:hypothetical protein
MRAAAILALKVVAFIACVVVYIIFQSSGFFEGGGH